MSWKPIARARGGKQGIWCSLSEKDVRITFGPDAATALKIKVGSKLEVAVGEDDHIGRIRLRIADGGLTVRKASAQSTSLGVSFRKWERLMDGACAPVNLPFKVVGDGVVEATLPYWGQAGKLKALKLT